MSPSFRVASAARASLLLWLALVIVVLGCDASPDTAPPAKSVSTAAIATASPTPTIVARPTEQSTVTPVATTPASLGAQLEAVLPDGVEFVSLPGASGPEGLVADLEGNGARDVVALYHDAAEARSYWLVVAGADATSHFRVLWRWNADGADPTVPGSFQVALVDFLGKGQPQLFVASRIGAAWEEIRVVSFDGGRANELLAALGDQPVVLTPRSGDLPGLAFWRHFTGPSGLEEVWQWDRQIGRFVRADGSFPEHYANDVIPRLEHDLSLAPTSPYLLYSLAVAYLQAGQDDRALTTARQGLASLPSLDRECSTCSFSSFEPDFEEVEATVYRRQGKCAQAVPLYSQIVASRQDQGSAFGWGTIPRSYYGLAVCAQQSGNLTAMRAYLQQAIAAGAAASSSDSIPSNQSWYGYARAEQLLGD